MLKYPTILALIICSCSRSQNYMSIPYHISQTKSSVKHIIQVQINRYPYSIDITLESKEDYIMNIQDAQIHRKQVERLDYRKNQNSTFAVVQYMPFQQADQRLELKRRLVYNTYYYFRNFLPKITWINLNTIKQIDHKDITEEMSEGSFNFGPKNRQSLILKNLKKYSDHMKQNILTFISYEDRGEIILGEYPLDKLNNSTTYSIINLDYLGRQRWVISTDALQLRKKSGKNIIQPNLYKQLVRLQITLSSKTIVLPIQSADTLLKLINNCKFQSIPEQTTGLQYLTCKDMSFDFLQELRLVFIISRSSITLELKLKDLIKYQANNKRIFYVRSGDSEQLQIGQSILQDYMVGLDYKNGKLYYGERKVQPWLDRFVLIKIFLVINVLIFVIGLTIVTMEKKIRDKFLIVIRQQIGIQTHRPSKVNAYQLADLSDDNIVQ